MSTCIVSILNFAGLIRRSGFGLRMTTARREASVHCIDCQNLEKSHSRCPRNTATETESLPGVASRLYPAATLTSGNMANVQ